MVQYLGERTSDGVLAATADNPWGSTSMWVVTFDPLKLSVSTGEFEVYHLALTGPAGSRVQWYIDRTFYDITNHGDVNSWDPNEACHLMAGNTIYFYWNSAVLPKPTVTLWLRQPPLL